APTAGCRSAISSICEAGAAASLPASAGNDGCGSFAVAIRLGDFAELLAVGARRELAMRHRALLRRLLVGGDRPPGAGRSRLRIERDRVAFVVERRDHAA